jgi:chorismate lyase
VSAIPRDRDWLRFPALSGPYRRWLTDRGSLTARVTARCPRFSVRLLFQGLRRPDRDEVFVFTGARGRRVLVREVFLCCAGTPVVFAHTVLEPDALRGPWRSLVGLGSRPLGAALFADPRVHRYPLHQRKLGPTHELHRRVSALLSRPPGPLWARRSLFALRGSPILVTEVFLPEILEL